MRIDLLVSAFALFDDDVPLLPRKNKKKTKRERERRRRTEREGLIFVDGFLEEGGRRGNLGKFLKSAVGFVPAGLYAFIYLILSEREKDRERERP